MNFPNLSVTLATSAWTTPTTSHKTMDVELAEVFAKILDAEMSKPNLGCATTGQLLDEIRSRVNCEYSTVFWENSVPPNGVVTSPVAP
jgi:hypothetical protein